MSLLIKALQKAEQGKEAKNGDSRQVVAAGLELEPVSQESKPALASVASSDTAAAPLELADHGFSLAQESTVAETSDLDSSAKDAVARVAASLEEEMGFNLAGEAGFTTPLASSVPSPRDPAKTSTPPPVQERKPVEPKAVDVPPPPSQANSEPAADAQRSAAAPMLNLQQGDRPVARLRNRRSAVLGTITLLLLLALGGGFYYYLGALDQSQFVAVAPPPASLPPAPLPKPAPASSASPVNTAGTGAVVTTAPPTLDTPSEATFPTTKNQAQKTSNGAPKPEKKSAKPAAKSLNGDGEALAPKVARMQKTEAAINAIQLAAYQAFNAGDDQTAERLYHQLSQSEPLNVDVLLGLAAVAARQDKMDEAVKTYQRVLALDPRNSVAQAGIITMLGQSNPAEAESRLKQLIAQQPDAAYLHAALGNAYSELNRWSDAQQSYFQAFRMDTGNADYAFNLAVSLDQIAKYDLALDYYQKASVLLAKQGSNVDKATLDSRIAQLRERLRK